MIKGIIKNMISVDVKDKMRYVILVEGEIDETWSTYFNNWQFEQDNGFTSLHSPLIDQSTLHGSLSVLRDLCLSIVDIHRKK